MVNKDEYSQGFYCKIHKINWKTLCELCRAAAHTGRKLC